jgi:Zn-dependent metalloprotease
VINDADTARRRRIFMRHQSLWTFIISILLCAAAAGSSERPGPFQMAMADLDAETGGRQHVVIDPATARARLIQVPAGSVQLEGATPIAKAKGFLARYGDLLGLPGTPRELELMSTNEDQIGMTHLVYRQTFGGVAVFGAQLRVHFDSSGELVTVNGTLVPDLALDTDPTISSETAESTARTLIAKEHRIPADTLGLPKVELLVYRSGLVRGIPGSNHLAWKVDIGDGRWIREDVFIDAHNGRLIDRIDRIHSITRTIYHRDFDTVLWSEGNGTPFSGLSTNKDVEVNDLINSAQETYDLFANLSAGQFLSYSGNDSPMRSIYEASFLKCPNATWNGSTANFCLGFAVDDVIAHEWTHGYTDSNHNLIYAWQPGALNESYSDIFGEIVDLLNERGLDDPGGPRTVGACSSFGGAALPLLEVVSPESIARQYNSAQAIWNPASWSSNGTVELVNDGTDTATDACEALTGFTAGRVALIDRGNCQFRTKVLNAEAAGAVAVIVANHEDDSLVTMSGGDPPPEIPGLFVGKTSGETFKSVVELGLEVNMGMSSGTDESVRWLTGEDINGGSGGIRDMWNPPCFNDPGRVLGGRYWCSAGDNGGVHINSGVSNRAFSLLVDGGAYNGQTLTGIGLTKAAHIYWRAMRVYQGPTTGFSEHADAMEQSCADLTGQPITSLTTGSVIGDTINTSDCEQVANVLAAVDMRATPPCDFNLVLEPDAPALPSGMVVFLESFSSDPGPDWVASTEGVYSEYNGDLHAWRWTNDVPRGGDGGAYWAINSAGPIYGNCEPGINDQSGVARLESPPIAIPATATSAILAFDHWVFTEDGWDGGNLRISVNGGEYQPATTSTFRFNPYNSQVIDSVTIDEQLIENTNPLAGEAAFTGQDEGHVFGGSWGQTQIVLDFFAQPGDTVRVRWNFGIDGCNGHEGWYIDNVQVIAEGVVTKLPVRRTTGQRVIPGGPF